MSRSTAILFLPVVLLGSLVALVVVRPWHPLVLRSLPAIFSAITPAPQTTPSNGPKMSAARLAAQLGSASSIAVVSTPLRWHCTADPQHVWDYVCRQPQLREVRGYDVNASSITKSTTLVFAGRRG